MDSHSINPPESDMGTTGGNPRRAASTEKVSVISVNEVSLRTLFEGVALARMARSPSLFHM